MLRLVYSRPGSALSLCSFLLATAANAQNTSIRVANPPEWGNAPRVIEEIRVGSLDGPQETQFGLITFVEPRRDGGFYVFDAQAPAIRLFDGQGRFVRDVGRSGAGPGEYGKTVQGIRTTLQDELAVWDPQQSRITLFDSSGRYLRDYRVTGSQFFGDQAFGVDTAGNFYLKYADMSQMKRPAPGQMALETDFPLSYLKLSLTGAVIDTIGLPQNSNSSRGFVLATSQGYRSNFMPESVAALSTRGYLVTGHTRTYALELHLPGGRVRRLVRDTPPIPLTGAERSMWEDWTASFQRRTNPQGRAANFQDLPRTKPAFRGLWVDHDGRIWVDRYVEARRVVVEPRKSGDDRPLFDWREPPTFDVLTPEGRLLGTVVFPASTYVYAAWGRYVWAETTGEDEAPYVVRFRIEGVK